VQRKVRKDGTVSYCGARFEVPYELSGRCVRLVVDPHSGQVRGVENDNGGSLGAATPLDALANVQRRRRQPQPPQEPSPKDTDNEVELSYRQYYGYTGEDG
jgi:hypothetical protein